MSRLGKVENIIRLIHQMASSGQGVSLADIMDDYAVSRRTAERMLGLVKEIYGSLLEVSVTDDFRKAYKLPTLYRQGPLLFSQEELNALTSAINLAKRYKMDDAAKAIEAVALRLRSIAKSNVKHNVEDMAELAEIGMLAGPQINVDPTIRFLLRSSTRIRGFTVYAFMHSNAFVLLTGSFGPAPSSPGTLRKPKYTGLYSTTNGVCQLAAHTSALIHTPLLLFLLYALLLFLFLFAGYFLGF